MAVLIPSHLPETKLNILSIFSGESENWMKAVAANGSMTLDMTEHDASSRRIVASPSLITNDPAQAAQGSDVFFLSAPATYHQQYLEAIAPFVEDGATIVGMPAYPGFVWVLNKIFRKDKVSKINVVRCSNLPWACRIISYGASVQVLGTKSMILACTSERAKLIKPQLCLGKYPVLQYSSGIAADLMTINPYVHLALMYAFWSRWDGQPMDTEPLLYQGVDEFAVQVMSTLSDELVLSVRDAVKQIGSGIDLDVVVHISRLYLDLYAADTDVDSSSLLRCLQTNRAYRGLKHSMKKVEGGKFVPDMKCRYMTEDLPMGLVPQRAIAHCLGFETPMTDTVITWCQEMLGKEYLKDAELNGKDIAETRAPVNFGISTIDEILCLP